MTPTTLSFAAETGEGIFFSLSLFPYVCFSLDLEDFSHPPFLLQKRTVPLSRGGHTLDLSRPSLTSCRAIQRACAPSSYSVNPWRPFFGCVSASPPPPRTFFPALASSPGSQHLQTLSSLTGSHREPCTPSARLYVNTPSTPYLLSTPSLPRPPRARSLPLSESPTESSSLFFFHLTLIATLSPPSLPKPKQKNLLQHAGVFDTFWASLPPDSSQSYATFFVCGVLIFLLLRNAFRNLHFPPPPPGLYPAFRCLSLHLLLLFDLISPPLPFTCP